MSCPNVVRIHISELIKTALSFYFSISFFREIIVTDVGCLLSLVFRRCTCRRKCSEKPDRFYMSD